MRQVHDVSETGVNRKRLLSSVAILVALISIAVLWKRQLSSQGEAQDGSGERDQRAQDSRHNPNNAGTRPELDRAHAVILGRVTDLEGEALAGARVCARSNRLHEEGFRPRCVKTDDEGRYQLPDLAPGRYVVYASAAEHQPLDVDLRLRAGAEARADFELLAGAVLVRGIVHDLAGGPIEGAVVSLAGDGVRADPRGAALVQTDAEGRFEAWVRRGRLHIYAGAKDYATRNIYSSAPGPTIELYLVPEVVIIGRIVDAQTGEGVAKVEVQPGRNPLDGPMKFTDTQEGWTRSDDEGNFRIAGLVPGSYQPYVANGQYRGVAGDILHLGFGETSDPIELRVTRAGTIQAQVLDQSGAPACIGGSATASPAFFEFYTSPVDDEGWVELGGLRPGDYNVNLHCWGRMLKEVASFTVLEGNGALDPQTWTIDRGLTMSGTVVDGRSDPLPRVVVVATMIPGPDDSRGPTARTARSEPTSKNGEFRLEGLDPGLYELEIGGSSGSKLLETMEVEVRPPGVEGVRLEAPVPGEIHGRVLGEDGSPVANMTVSAYGQAAGFQDALSDDEGKFILTDLGPNSYRVVAIDGRWNIEIGSTEVELESGGSAEADLHVTANGGTIRGQAHDDGGTPLDDVFITIERQSEPLDQAAPKGRFRYADFKGKPVLTDLQGEFQIDGLPAGHYTIHAKQKQGGEVATVDVEPGQYVKLVIPAVARMSGTLVMAESGEPITDYAITAEHEDGHFTARAEWREGAGTWQFNQVPPGRYTLIAASPLGDAQTTVELAPGAELENQRIELQARVKIRGQVIDASTRSPIPNAEVRVAAPGAEIMGIGHVEWVTTDTKGRFSMTVPRGELPLRIIPAGSDEGRKHEGLRTKIEIGGEAEQELEPYELEPR